MFMPVDFVNASNKMNVSKANAGRLVMTESAYFSSAAQKECFKELDVERYEIVATLDGHTSDICQEMDGKVFKMSEYEEGVTAPPFHVNCRSCTAPYFDDEFTKGERIARNEDGDTYYVPADMTYGEWRNKYIDLKNDSEYQDKINERRAKVGVKNLEKLHSSDIMKSKVTSGALTDNNDPLYEKRNRHANSYYDSIRNSKKNNIVNTIASNTGMAESDISKIYDHVFINEYELYGGKRRFDPDYDMAESFRRLREGKEIQEHDLILLSHERLEYELMNKEGMTYQEAHSIAEAKYNYRKALDEFKHKNGLL
ncbi:minor capsid protein [Eubacterium ventriosum]|uniref:minor capsid protein n=1 Tax=Eubacterium ventriosum TaxID=39496 RepID=UPI00241DD5D5|nr:minor capsid protein [Eubacterium ventriosum]